MLQTGAHPASLCPAAWDGSCSASRLLRQPLSSPWVPPAVTATRLCPGAALRCTNALHGLGWAPPSHAAAVALEGAGTARAWRGWGRTGPGLQGRIRAAATRASCPCQPAGVPGTVPAQRGAGGCASPAGKFPRKQPAGGVLSSLVPLESGSERHGREPAAEPQRGAAGRDPRGCERLCPLGTAVPWARRGLCWDRR